MLTYQSEYNESNAADGRRTPSSKISSHQDDAPSEVQDEETDEKQRDEKVRFQSFIRYSFLCVHPFIV